MNRWHFAKPFVLLVALLSYPVLASAGVCTVNTGGERFEFVPQAEKGYVIKLAEKAGGIHALAGLPALDAGDAREVRGLDRRGVWTVENEGPADRNKETLRSLQAGGQVAYAAPLFSAGGETVAIIPEIVVRVKACTEIEQLKALCEKGGCAIRKRMEFTQQEYLLEVLGPDAEAVFAAVGQLSQAACVEWACPNTAFQPKLGGQAVPGDHDSNERLRITAAGQDANTPGVFPNDKYFPNQWHLHNAGQSGGTPGADIRAPEAWEITTGNPNIIIAVIDTGVDTKHPDLIDNLVPGYDFYDNDGQPDPATDHMNNAHGTCCAGLIAARGNNGIGVTGVTWNCRIMPIRTISFRVDGTQVETTEADTAAAFRWAARNGADVLSYSWGQASPLPAVRSAIVDVTKLGGMGRHGKGCIVLACSDNDNGPVRYPAKYPEVIALGATGPDDQRCLYSNYGPELDIVAPSAPGYTVQDWLKTQGRGWVWTTDIGGPAGYNTFAPSIVDYTAFAGTSASCPIAAGVAALILSVEPNLTSDEVRHFLERSAKDLGDPGRDDYYGWGRVDARAALDMVLAKRADLNNDWKVDEKDRAILMKAMETNDLSADIAPAPKRDGKVDQEDLDLLMRYWQVEIPEMTEPGLIAYWRFDEAEGETAHEAINHRDGIPHGGPIWQPTQGMMGGAIQLDGVDDYTATPFVLNPSTPSFSVFAWVKGGAPSQVILSQSTGADWLIADTTEGVLRTDLRQPKVGRQPGGLPLSSHVAITDGNWHRAGFVWDGSNRILYVDDVEVARDTQASLAGSTGNLSIGTGSTMTPSSFWQGLIDDVRIYDRAVKP